MDKIAGLLTDNIYLEENIETYSFSTVENQVLEQNLCGSQNATQVNSAIAFQGLSLAFFHLI